MGSSSSSIATYQEFVDSCKGESQCVTKELSSMRVHVGLCGGKAFNLSFLLSNASKRKREVHVPNGLCILTNGFVAHINECLPQLTRFADCASLDDAWTRIRTLSESDQRYALSDLAGQVKDTPLNEELKREVDNWVSAQSEDSKSFAVRSSATDEDSGTNSFAGQYLTLLNQSPSDIELAVKSVWASAFSYHSFAYRLKRNVIEPPRLGVVIMPQIQSAVSGVLFTRSPMSLDDDTMLLEATFGQGEGVVSGEVGVDRWSLSKATQRVLQARLSPKKARYVLERQRSGLKLEGNADADVNRACLNPQQLQDLMKVGMAVEKLYGSFQDIEFAISEHNEIYVVQSRPITTIVKSSIDISDVKVPHGNWQLERTHFSCAIPKVFEGVASYANRRNFQDGFRRYGMALDYIDICFIKGFAYSAARPYGAPIKTGPEKLPPKALMHLLFKLNPELRRRGEISARNYVDKLYLEDWKEWDTKERNETIRKHIVLADELPSIHTLSTDAYLVLLDRAYQHACHGMNMHHKHSVTCMMPSGDLIAHGPKWGLSPTELFALVQGTARPSGILGTAQRVRNWMSLIAADQIARRVLFSDEFEAAEIFEQLKKWPGDLGAFLSEATRVTQYRLVHSYECSQPTLIEQPQHIVADLRLAAQGRMLMSDEEVKLQHAYRARVRVRVPEEDRALFDERVAEAELMAPLRDDRHLWCDGISTGLLRHVLLEGGRRLVRAGRIQQEADIMEMELQDVQSVFRGSAAPSAQELTDRRTFRATHTWADMPPFIGAPMGEFPPLDFFPEKFRRTEAAAQALLQHMFTASHNNGGTKRGGDEMEGIAGGAAKVVDGPVRIIKSVNDLGAVQAGEVVIAVNTSAAFNAVLAVCSAVITEGGGLLSHAAVTAREMDKAAVVAVMKATSLLATGDRVRVNGKTGVITKLM